MARNTIKLFLYLPDREFLIPYIERELTDVELVADVADADVVTAIVGIDDKVPDEISTRAMILRSPNIVGTGMIGLPMRIAGKIMNGTYFHVKDNQARLSVIHAVDVARAVRMTMGVKGEYVVTDGVNPTVYDFAEALAYRIDQKRIYTLKPKYAKLLLGKTLFDTVVNDNVADGTDFVSRFDFHPVSVTDYLHTHVYDDESL